MFLGSVSSGPLNTLGEPENKVGPKTCLGMTYTERTHSKGKASSIGPKMSLFTWQHSLGCAASTQTLGFESESNSGSPGGVSSSQTGDFFSEET